MSDLLPPPNQLGAPDHFTHWRDKQDQAVVDALSSDRRFVCLAMPTGMGKSITYMTLANMLGDRAIILTSTKALQQQLTREFGPTGLYDIRGQNNYPCRILQPGGEMFSPHLQSWMTNCDNGPCHGGLECVWRKGGCGYYDQLGGAKVARMVVTNYSYWLHSGEGLGPVGTLVLDESHDGPSALSDFLHAALDAYQLDLLSGKANGIPHDLDCGRWRVWAANGLAWVKMRTEELKLKVKTGTGTKTTMGELRTLREVEKQLARMAEMTGEWVLERVGGGVSCDPLWPAPYSEECLFRGVKRVVLVSATIRPKTCDILGIPSDQLEFREYPAIFPVSRRPVYHIPTIRLTHRSTDTDLRTWVTRIDQIIRKRLDRKGVVHTVSYARRNFLMSHSEYSKIMLTHDTKTTSRVVEEFKRSSAPCVLVSPSVSTGVDFPGVECEYSIIGKVPFLDTRAAVIGARCKSDPDYSPYYAVQEIIQMSGRGMRCFSLDTEILTTTGWKRFNGIQAGDTVYGIDTKAFEPTTVRKGTSRTSRSRSVLKGSPRLVPHKVRQVKVNGEPEPMVRVHAKCLDALVTRDHTMVIQPVRVKTYQSTSHKSYGRGVYFQDVIRKHVTNPLTKVRADSLPARFRMPLAGCAYRKERAIGRAALGSDCKWWFWLMGFIVADGHISTTQSAVHIYQAKPETIVQIEDILEKLKLNPKRAFRAAVDTVMVVGDGPEYVRNYDCMHWIFAGYEAAAIRDIFHSGHVRRHSLKRQYRQRSHKGTHGYDRVDGWKDVERTIPRWVIERASVNQMRMFLAGMMAGDGTWHTVGESGTYFTKEKSLADRLQEMLVLSGFRSSIRSRRGQFEVGFVRDGSVDCPKATAVEPAGEQMSWCVSTELGTVVMRRKGKTFIAGNSAEDRHETFIVDDQVVWFLPKYRRFVPGWFWESYRRCVVVPEPPQKL